MNDDHGSVIRRQPEPDPPRLILLGLALLCVGFAAYGSLVPLRLQSVPLDVAIDRFLATPFVPLADASKTDFISNVALFFPVGFFLAGALAGRTRRAALGWLPVVLGLSLVASILIEFSQVFASGRTPSWNDVFAESLGAVLGGLGWATIGAFASDWVVAIGRPQTPRDLAVRVLGIYTALWVLLALLPLDFTIRPAEVAAKLRRGRIVLTPFTGSANVAEGVQDTVGTLLMAVPVGALAALVVGNGRSRSHPFEPLGLAVIAVAGVEALQVFVVSRTADVTDVLMGGIGAFVGVVVAKRWAGRVPMPARTPARRGGGAWWPLALLLAWGVIVVSRHWSPFEFTRDTALVAERARNLPWVPFQSYYWARPLDSLAEASTKILLGVPVGALLQLAWATPAAVWARRAQMAAFLGLGILFFGGVEAGQVLLPARFPDPTDIGLGTIGVFVGLLVVRRFER